MLRRDEWWFWDSWIADDGTDYHLYFLQAPADLLDGSKRHARARIGRASSPDLREWTYQGEVFGPGPAGAWDDLAIWTGSVVQDDAGLWHMFYTAISNRGHELKDQRIGLAVSEDLQNWTRVGDAPVVPVDPTRYKTLAEDSTASETWRDPFVYRDPDGNGWHMLICARAVGAAQNDDGVLAHAWSADLRTWELGDPVCAPGAGFGQLEVAQIREIDGQIVMVFTCHPQEMTPERIARSGRASTWWVRGDSITGTWDIDAAQPFVDDPWLFAAPLVADRKGDWNFLGFRNLEPEGILDFAIVDPITVEWRGGELRSTHPVPTYDANAQPIVLD